MSDYSGEMIGLEVARYGLRTFRPIPLGGRAPLAFPFVDIDPWGHRGDVELSSVFISGPRWTSGTCAARCLAHLSDSALVTRSLSLSVAGWSLWARSQPYRVEEVPSHEAPHEDCQCGIYAAHTLEHLVAQYPVQTGHIVAVIAAEGQTIIGDKGFRTQYARVVAYWCVDTLTEPAKRQFKGAQRYGKIDDMLVAYGFREKKPVSAWKKILLARGLRDQCA